jgi:hypothetical protein
VERDTALQVISRDIDKHTERQLIKKPGSALIATKHTFRCPHIACTCARTIKVANASTVEKDSVVLGFYKVTFAHIRVRNHSHAQLVRNHLRTSLTCARIYRLIRRRSRTSADAVERRSHLKATCINMKSLRACEARNLDSNIRENLFIIEDIILDIITKRHKRILQQFVDKHTKQKTIKHI